jgi:hypothetical protein
MARHEADREDFLAEAVALTRRVEGVLADRETVVVAGFRAGDWLSVYFGPDPMYQVDSAGRLRRAFEDGFLFRTQGETLARLTRTRTATETALVRHDLTPGELAAFRGRMTDRLADFVAALESQSFRPQRQIPVADATLLDDIAARLRRSLTAEPWLAPAIAGRK